MTTTPAHVTTALRAVLDHIDTHQLPLPTEITLPGHHYASTHPDAIGLQIPWGRENFARYEETLLDADDSYTYTARRMPSGIPEVDDFEVATIHATLPPMGVRVVLTGRWRIDHTAPLRSVAP